MESNMQFQSKQLDLQSTEPEKDSCTSTDDLVAEFSSADNSVHTSAPSETSRSSAQQRARPRSGKCPLEKAMIEIERKKLDLMQSMGNGLEDWDRTYRFLMSLWEPIKRLPEDSQMFLRLNIQETIFRETPKQRGTKVASVHLKCSSFITRMEDRITEKEANGPITFPDFHRVTTVLYSKLLAFPLSNIPHFVVGSLSLPYLSSQ